MKNFKDIRKTLGEEYGAGEWGTDELTNKYKAMTPGQNPVTEAKWKVTFVHNHPEGEKKHDYVVSAPHQNAADKKAIEAHRQQHPKGDFEMWNSEELHEAGLEDACWKGYEAIGMKMKGGRKVPNCVPKEAVTKVSVTSPIGHRIADIGPGGKEHNVQTKNWPSDHAADARTAHQAAHAALKKGDIETYHKEMDKKFASHQAASAEASKKPVKTYEAFTPDAGRQTQIGKDHTDLKARSTADLHKIHQGTLGKIHSKYTPAEVGGKQGMIADILRHRHGDKHVAHYFGLEEDTTTIEKPVAEESDDKNLRITKHERLAIEAEKRGDKRAQQFHLDKVNKLKTESVNEATKAESQKHLVTVTVTDPQHPMVSKRKEKIMKRVKVSAVDPKDAIKKAESHYKKHGFKVHDSLHHSVVKESLDSDEIIDGYDAEEDAEELSMAKAQLREIVDMAQDLIDSMEDSDELEAWMASKITSANKDIDDVYSSIAYGDESE